MKIDFFKYAGLITLSWGEGRNNKCFHLLVLNPEHWYWGHQVEKYDCCLDYYGLGPLFLFVK